MKTILLAFAVAWICAAAESSGFVFAGAGNESQRGDAYTRLGVGGEWVIGRSPAGVGGEVGGMWGRRFAPDLAIVSANVYGHLPLGGALDPFVTIGPSIATNGSSAAYLTNYGGGVHWWFRPRIGMRAEIRDHYWHGEGRHLTDFRIGLSFR